MTLDPPAIPADTIEAAQPASAPRPRICPNCGSEFFRPAKGPGGHKRFCSDPCRVGWGNREKAQGAVLVTIAKIWRKNRGSGELGKAAFARLTETLDLLIEDDEKAGRPKLLASGPIEPFLTSVVEERYLDRKRR